MKEAQPKVILIVDDQIENLNIISSIFETECPNTEIVNAPNGLIALKLIEKVQPDLIITDWEMPEMDGIELIKQLKKNSISADIPIIMCTGVMTSSESLEIALNAGASDYIRKPVDQVELIARTKANLHLSEKYNEIKALNKAKDTIFSIISHDLKGPVGTMKSFIDMMIKDNSYFSSNQIMRYLGMISKQSSSVYYTLNNLLEWAICQGNNITFEPKFQSLESAVQSNIDLFDEIARQKKIKLINDINPSVFAFFDNNLISTVVRNLISNAIKFTSENGVVTIFSTVSEEKIIVTVFDTGIGIKSDRIEKLFDSKSYETSFGTKKEKGSGLGLKICKDFIEAHGEKIWVESEVNAGSAFKFSLRKLALG